MPEVSVFRFYLLRAMYLFMAVGLGLFIWPNLIDHKLSWPHMNGVVSAMLGALAILAAFGLRYPLQMLPVLLFDFLWKSIWMIAVVVPLWQAGQINEATKQTIIDCVPAILIPLVVPWGYVFGQYVTRPGDRWK